MLILGIDPGNVRIGYGAVEDISGKLTYRASGLLEIPQKDQVGRLVAIEIELKKLLRTIHPQRVGVEKLFFTKNQKTAFGVAEARGVILATLAKNGFQVIELTPSEIKRLVTGDGGATKDGVARVVQMLLKLQPKKQVDDITDALAIAIAASGVRWG